jgi:toxin YoeB
MEIILLPDAENDLNFWIKSGNKPVLKKITQLIEDIINTPYEGVGKPEQLNYKLKGCWSRRINKEHRLIYEIDADKILVHSLKGHY